MDKNGSIDYNEFVLASLNSTSLIDKARLENTFKLFDKDGSGSISAAEIQEILGKNIDMKVIKEMIKEGKYFIYNLLSGYRRKRRDRIQRISNNDEKYIQINRP